tara:strand:+ start:90 stop:563 length:474 start_codon:yes stop_codon:yes gene_type:complete
MFKTSPYYLDTETCPHWIPITQECYACIRDKKRADNRFVNCSIKPKNKNKSFHETDYIDDIFINNNEYINPDNYRRQIYTNKPNNQNSINTNNRYFDTNITQSLDLPASNFYGADTRNNNIKKQYKNSNNLHLRRSMIQPDKRYGNRFYEYKPHSSR